MPASPTSPLPGNNKAYPNNNNNNNTRRLVSFRYHDGKWKYLSSVPDDATSIANNNKRTGNVTKSGWGTQELRNYFIPQNKDGGGNNNNSNHNRSPSSPVASSSSSAAAAAGKSGSFYRILAIFEGNFDAEGRRDGWGTLRVFRPLTNNNNSGSKSPVKGGNNNNNNNNNNNSMMTCISLACRWVADVPQIDWDPGRLVEELLRSPQQINALQQSETETDDSPTEKLEPACEIYNDCSRRLISVYNGLMLTMSEDFTSDRFEHGLLWALSTQFLPHTLGEKHDLLIPHPTNPGNFIPAQQGGIKFCGQWQMGEKHGFGMERQISTGGLLYAGPYESGVRHGVGLLFHHQSKTCLDATWNRGRIADCPGALHIQGFPINVLGRWSGDSTVTQGRLCRSNGASGLWEMLFADFDEQMANLQEEIEAMMTMKQEQQQNAGNNTSPVLSSSSMMSHSNLLMSSGSLSASTSPARVPIWSSMNNNDSTIASSSSLVFSLAQLMLSSIIVPTSPSSKIISSSYNNHIHHQQHFIDGLRTRILVARDEVSAVCEPIGCALATPQMRSLLTVFQRCFLFSYGSCSPSGDDVGGGVMTALEMAAATPPNNNNSNTITQEDHSAGNQEPSIHNLRTEDESDDVFLAPKSCMSWCALAVRDMCQRDIFPKDFITSTMSSSAAASNDFDSCESHSNIQQQQLLCIHRQRNSRDSELEVFTRSVEDVVALVISVRLRLMNLANSTIIGSGGHGLSSPSSNFSAESIIHNFNPEQQNNNGNNNNHMTAAIAKQIARTAASTSPTASESRLTNATTVAAATSDESKTEEKTKTMSPPPTTHFNGILNPSLMKDPFFVFVSTNNNNSNHYHNGEQKQDHHHQDPMSELLSTTTATTNGNNDEETAYKLQHDTAVFSNAFVSPQIQQLSLSGTPLSPSARAGVCSWDAALDIALPPLLKHAASVCKIDNAKFVLSTKRLATYAKSFTENNNNNNNSSANTKSKRDQEEASSSSSPHSFETKALELLSMLLPSKIVNDASSCSEQESKRKQRKKDKNNKKQNNNNNDIEDDVSSGGAANSECNHVGDDDKADNNNTVVQDANNNNSNSSSSPLSPPTRQDTAEADLDSMKKKDDDDDDAHGVSKKTKDQILTATLQKAIARYASQLITATRILANCFTSSSLHEYQAGQTLSSTTVAVASESTQSGLLFGSYRTPHEVNNNNNENNDTNPSSSNSNSNSKQKLRSNKAERLRRVGVDGAVSSLVGAATSSCAKIKDASTEFTEVVANAYLQHHSSAIIIRSTDKNENDSSSSSDIKEFINTLLTSIIHPRQILYQVGFRFVVCFAALTTSAPRSILPQLVLLDTICEAEAPEKSFAKPMMNSFSSSNSTTAARNSNSKNSSSPSSSEQQQQRQIDPNSRLVNENAALVSKEIYQESSDEMSCSLLGLWRSDGGFSMMNQNNKNKNNNNNNNTEILPSAAVPLATGAVFPVTLFGQWAIRSLRSAILEITSLANTPSPVVSHTTTTTTGNKSKCKSCCCFVDKKNTAENSSSCFCSCTFFTALFSCDVKGRVEDVLRDLTKAPDTNPILPNNNNSSNSTTTTTTVTSGSESSSSSLTNKIISRLIINPVAWFPEYRRTIRRPAQSLENSGNPAMLEGGGNGNEPVEALFSNSLSPSLDPSGGGSVSHHSNDGGANKSSSGNSNGNNGKKDGHSSTKAEPISDSGFANIVDKAMNLMKASSKNIVVSTTLLNQLQQQQQLAAAAAAAGQTSSRGSTSNPAGSFSARGVHHHHHHESSPLLYQTASAAATAAAVSASGSPNLTHHPNSSGPNFNNTNNNNLASAATSSSILVPIQNDTHEKELMRRVTKLSLVLKDLSIRTDMSIKKDSMTSSSDEDGDGENSDEDDFMMTNGSGSKKNPAVSGGGGENDKKGSASSNNTSQQQDPTTNSHQPQNTNRESNASSSSTTAAKKKKNVFADSSSSSSSSSEDFTKQHQQQPLQQQQQQGSASNSNASKKTVSYSTTASNFGGKSTTNRTIGASTTNTYQRMRLLSTIQPAAGAGVCEKKLVVKFSSDSHFDSDTLSEYLATSSSQKEDLVAMGDNNNNNEDRREQKYIKKMQRLKKLKRQQQQNCQSIDEDAMESILEYWVGRRQMFRSTKS